MDILSDGELDYPNEMLAQFDFVLASVHSRMTQPVEEMTARLLKGAGESLRADSRPPDRTPD